MTDNTTWRWLLELVTRSHKKTVLVSTVAHEGRMREDEVVELLFILQKVETMMSWWSFMSDTHQTMSFMILLLVGNRIWNWNSRTNQMKAGFLKTKC